MEISLRACGRVFYRHLVSVFPIVESMRFLALFFLMSILITSGCRHDQQLIECPNADDGNVPTANRLTNPFTFEGNRVYLWFNRKDFLVGSKGNNYFAPWWFSSVQINNKLLCSSTQSIKLNEIDYSAPLNCSAENYSNVSSPYPYSQPRHWTFFNDQDNEIFSFDDYEETPSVYTTYHRLKIDKNLDLQLDFDQYRSDSCLISVGPISKTLDGQSLSCTFYSSELQSLDCGPLSIRFFAYNRIDTLVGGINVTCITSDTRYRPALVLP